MGVNGLVLWMDGSLHRSALLMFSFSLPFSLLFFLAGFGAVGRIFEDIDLVCHSYRIPVSFSSFFYPRHPTARFTIRLFVLVHDCCSISRSLQLVFVSSDKKPERYVEKVDQSNRPHQAKKASGSPKRSECGAQDERK